MPAPLQPINWNAPPTMTTRVEIPGEVIATYQDGRITALVFVPWAGDAGYFGPAATVFDGDALDVEDTDGPFWKAMQDRVGAAGADAPVITWEE